MPKAFFKTINGTKRWRIVVDGQEADNLGLDLNLVVFDSDFASTWSVYQSGVFTVATKPADNSKIIGWPTLPYAPVTDANFSSADTTANYLDAILGSPSNGALAVAVARADGLYLYPGPMIFPINVWYVVYRAAAS